MERREQVVELAERYMGAYSCHGETRIVKQLQDAFGGRENWPNYIVAAGQDVFRVTGDNIDWLVPWKPFEDADDAIRLVEQMPDEVKISYGAGVWIAERGRTKCAAETFPEAVAGLAWQT